MGKVYGDDEIELQSDRVELKFKHENEVAGLIKASIGPGGIEIVESKRDTAEQNTASIGPGGIEIEPRGAHAATRPRFNRTGWN